MTDQAQPQKTTGEEFGFRMPWGLIGAIFILLCVEAGVRQMQPLEMIPNERGIINYRAVRLTMQAGLAPEIIFAGSSRMQMGILPEAFRERFSDRLGRDVTVGNFAVGGSRANENVPMLEYLARQEQKPRLVIYGVTMDQVRGDEIFSERAAIYCDFQDWLRYREDSPEQTAPYMSDVIRNEIGNVYHTFRYRGLAIVKLRELARGERLPMPFLGDSVAEHLKKSNKQLVDSLEIREDVRKHLREVHMKNGEYNFNELLLKRIDRGIAKCKAAGIEVILVEAPNSPIFNEELPPGAFERFHKEFEKIAENNEIDFLTLDELEVAFGTPEFRDPVHLATDAAREFTLAIAHKLPRDYVIAIDSRLPPRELVGAK
jgi:hypothetical protein